MSRKQDLIELKSVQGERLTPKEFLRLVKDRPHIIVQSRFIAPTVGGRDFGAFEVKYAVPILKRSAV